MARLDEDTSETRNDCAKAQTVFLLLFLSVPMFYGVKPKSEGQKLREPLPSI
jgi:hypothetical protein